MEIKNAHIFSATAKPLYDDTELWNSVIKYWSPPEVNQNEPKISFTLENSESLASIYNKAIQNALDDDSDCLILVHDDVVLEENPIPKLEKLFDSYDLVGVAGASKVELKSPALWHIMGGGFNGGYLHGCVQHLKREIISYMPLLERNSKPKTNFGPYPHQVVMIDGVFMALNRKVMKTMRFEEDNPCKFHFYDLDFSLNCHLNKLKVGVGDILITHSSPGLREFTQDWKNGEKWFLQKYDN